MKTELKDVFHLYLGCEAKGTSKNKKKIYMSSLNASDLSMVDKAQIKIKPILRQLDDMTQDEAIELSMICYKSIFGYTTECQVMDFKAAPSEIGIVLFSQEQNDRIGFTVNESEIEFSINSKTMIVNHYLVFLKLLQLGFDLFGLIESEQAFNKN